MSAKKYNIEIPKLDYQVISIGIKKDGEYVQLGENDLMFMTVSYTPRFNRIQISKKLRQWNNL